jgi:DNA-binding beta-propeller fold protein YncE
VGVLASHPAHPFLVGNFGQGLLFVFPKEGRLEALPLPARPLAFAFDPDGKALYVLTADGRLHRLDPKERRVVASLEAVSPEAQGAPTARMAVGHGVAFVTDPVRGEVVRVELDRFQVSGRFSVGGKPRNIALFQVEGVEH